MEFALAVVGATDVAVRTSSKLWQLSSAWRDAPVDIHNLRDDLTRTERFFGEIQQQLSSRRIVGSPVEKEAFANQSELGRLIDEGAVALRRIEAIIDGLTVPGDHDEVSKRRRFLWLRQSRKVARLRKELAHTRSSICRLLITQNITMSSEIHATLEHSHTEVTSQLSGLSLSINTSQDVLLNQLNHRMEAMEARMLSAIQSPQSPDPKDIYMFSPIRQLVRRPPSPNPFSHRLPTLCDPTCPCACHQNKSHLFRFTLLRSLIGMVAIAYASRSSTPCTNPHCLTPRSSHPIHDLHLAYHLPAWLSRISLTAFATTSLNGSPALNLRVYYRRSPLEAQAPLGVSRLIDQGDVSSLRTALQTGRTSIYDLFCSTGETALSLALNMQTVEIIRLYLQAGADPFYVHDDGNTVVRVAFLFSIAGGTAREKEIGELFVERGVIGRYVEEADFTALQRGVLAGVDLGGLLAKVQDGEEIDRVSGGGWTALHLAAAKGDVRAVRTLLRAGARVDVLVGETRVAPLYFACRYGHLEVVKMLLQGGAEVGYADRLGRQGIHLAVVTARAVDIVKVLLKYGADIEARGQHDYSPLMYAVIWGRLEIVEFLLERGADLESMSDHNDTMLIMAVRARRHEKARFLLRVGAKVQGLDATERNLLHHIASNGDEEMMRIFMETEAWRGWTGVAAKDMFGLTPLALFNATNPGDELREAFERLMDWVERCNVEEDTSEDISEDEWFDAEDGGWSEGSERDGSEKDSIWDTETCV